MHTCVFLHSLTFIHLHTTPQNVFLTSKGIVKVGDFGIAKALDSTVDMARTQIGTPYYLCVSAVVLPAFCQSVSGSICANSIFYLNQLRCIFWHEMLLSLTPEAYRYFCYSESG